MDTMSSHRTRLVAALAVTAWALLFGASPTPAKDREVSIARVVWVRGERVYLATADSTALIPGRHVDVLEHRRVLAGAEVDRRFDATLVVARITSGSLDHARHLDRLVVRAGAAPAAPPLVRLRVGLPTARANPLFACATPLEVAPPGYRRDAAGDRWLRAAGADAAAPETLVLVAFADGGDEEIALERGDIDVAVFWPGERSTRLREDPRWRDAPLVPRRGVLAARPADLRPDSLAVAALNRQVFRDELLPVAARDAGAAVAGVRFEVDPRVPGRAAIEHALHRQSWSGDGAITLDYLDATPERLDPSAGWRPLLAMRSAVVAAPELQSRIRPLLPMLAALTECGTRR
jgi:hypothetical protein